jgi:dTDP-4-dehydrorhamnose reductase
MKVLVTGGGGQVATALSSRKPDGVELIVSGIDQLDVTRRDVVDSLMRQLRPQVIINAAAYTAVDRAESERDAAFAVNAEGPVHLAEAAERHGARLLHLSTDFVFDGARPTPYAPRDAANPLNVYGASKRAGEERVMALCGERALVLRTAWVYAESGHNFARTVLRLCAEKPELRIVMDQVGSPTWAQSVAQALWAAVEQGIGGLHHWTDAGVASWYDFAVAIQEEALALGLLAKPVPIHPVRSADHSGPARRPPYSVLDTQAFQRATGLVPVHWRDNLRQMLRNLGNG